MNWLRKLFTKHKVKTKKRSKHLTQEEKSHLSVDYMINKLTTKQLMDKYNVSQATVYKYKKGWVMSKRDELEMAEFREEMRQEAYEEQWHEKQMYSDVEYVLEHTDAKDAIEILERVSKILSEYGHELSIADIVDMY